MMKIMVTIVCTIVFFCSSMMMTSTYSLLTLIITENDFNMILFPLLLVVFWIIENKVYTYLSNGIDIMSIEDKKLCHFVSLICLCLIGLYYN